VSPASDAGLAFDLGIEPPTQRQRKRKKQSDQGPLIMMGIVGVLLVSGLIVGLAMMQRSNSPSPPTVARTPPPRSVDPPQPPKVDTKQNPPVQPVSPKVVSPEVVPPKVVSPTPVITERPELQDAMPPRIAGDDPPKVATTAPAEPPPTGTLRKLPSMIDDQDPTGFRLVGDDWEFVTQRGAFIKDGHRAHPPGIGQAEAVWTFDRLEPGKQYTVLTTWNPHEVHATRAPYQITGISGMDKTVWVDQVAPPRADQMISGLPFQKLATVTCAAGTITVRLTDQADQYIVADAVYLMAGAGPGPAKVADEVPDIQLNLPGPDSKQPNRFAVPPRAPAAKRRVPVPTEAAQKEAEKLVNEVFAEDFRKAHSPEEKLSLAETLATQAAKSRDDAERHVLLEDACKLAVSAGKVECAMSVVDSLTAQYDIDAWATQIATMDELVKSARDESSREQLVFSAISCADRAIAAEKFEVAIQMLTTAREVATRAGSQSLARQLADRKKIVAEQAKEFAVASEARQKLEENPDNPEANLALGTYLCFVRRDWDHGLPNLAKGADTKLAEIAKTEAESPRDPEAQTQLADQWWAQAENANGSAKSSMLDRAGFWYRRALPALSGLAQTKVQQRIEELSAVLAAAKEDETKEIGGSRTLARKIKEAIKQKNLTRTAIFGVSANAQQMFEEVPSAAMLMVGIKYCLKPGTRVMAVQPIYAGVKESTLGGWYGGDARLGVVGQTMAPAGYAVGGLEAYGDGYLHGFRVIYMKITSSGLDPDDSRLSPLIGYSEDGIPTLTLGGNGQPVVGLFGTVVPVARLIGFGLIQIGK
jgi:hypothetical protein